MYRVYGSLRTPSGHPPARSTLPDRWFNDTGPYSIAGRLFIVARPWIRAPVVKTPESQIPLPFLRPIFAEKYVTYTYVLLLFFIWIFSLSSFFSFCACLRTKNGIPRGDHLPTTTTAQVIWTYIRPRSLKIRFMIVNIIVVLYCYKR